MFNYTALAFVLPESPGETEPHLQVVPRTKACPCCQLEKGLSEFHSKGKDRHEHICKSCSNDKKAQRRRKKRRIAKRKRSKSRTLALSTVEVVGELDCTTIEAFGNTYGNMIQEILDDSRQSTNEG